MCHPNIEKVILFGSRAIGSYKPTSDIDLAIIGKKVDLSLIFLLNHQLDQLPIIQSFDLLFYNKTENQNLLKHIENQGIEIYLRKTNKLPPQ